MRIIILAAGIFMLGGCAAMNSRAISYQDHGDRLFVWKSNYSAGMASKEGGLCAQGALTAVATSLSATAKGSGGAPSTPSGELTFEQQQALAMINASNAQTAYANIAFFYLCQIANNAHLEPQHIVQMWSQTNLAVAMVGAASSAATASSATLTTANTTQTSPSTKTGSSGAGSGSETSGGATAPATTTTHVVTDAAAPTSAASTISKGVADAFKNLSETVKQTAPVAGQPASGTTQPPQANIDNPQPVQP